VNSVASGVDASGIVTGQISLGDHDYTTASGTAFYERMQQELEGHPAVESVGLEWHVVLGAVRSFSTVSGWAGPINVRYNVVARGYFDAMGVQVLAGREFTRDDRDGAAATAIVNQTLAARLGGNVLGRTIVLAPERTPRRIIGIVGNVKYNALTEPAQPFVYLPLAQAFRPDIWVHVRSRTPGAGAILQEALRRLDPRIALADVRTHSGRIDEAGTTPRAFARVSVALAAIAGVLAIVGIYGLFATAVEERRRELAIGLAMGATSRTIVAGIAVRGLRLTVAGLALGVALSSYATRGLAGMLYDVPVRDAGVFMAVPCILLLASIPAWLVPAWRAAGSDPAVLFRSE
jgi:predicted lysophospholipase L1 biosynthesis ABC-type transport system permease subunit